MMKYQVVLVRPVLESAAAVVEADEEGDAREQALALAQRLDEHEWKLTDRSGTPIVDYVKERE